MFNNRVVFVYKKALYQTKEVTVEDSRLPAAYD
jgi:hypothetical protein